MNDNLKIRTPPKKTLGREFRKLKLTRERRLIF